MSFNIETLNVITPFKNKKIKIYKNYRIINKISFFIRVNHFVIYDITSSRNLTEIKTNLNRI